MVTSRIHFAKPGWGMEQSSLTSGWGLSDHSAIGWLVAVDDLEDVVGYWDAVDCLKVQMTVADKSEA